jgi:hypothetical protein
MMITQTDDEQTPTTPTEPVTTVPAPTPEPAPTPSLLGRTRQQTRAQQVLETLLSLTPRARTPSPTPEPNVETLISTTTEDDNVDKSDQQDPSKENLSAISEQDEVSTSNDTSTTDNEQVVEHQDTETPDADTIGIDRENMDRILASHVRETVHELNNALDDADMEDDGALAQDLVNRAHQLLNDGLKTKSARKLQNWISVTEQCYRSQLEQLNQSTHVINAIKYFDELIEDAQRYYDKWLQDETAERLKQQKDNLKKLRGHPKPTDKVDSELT